MGVKAFELAVFCGTALATAPASAGVRFDFEPRAFVPAGHYVKDHTVAREGGLYHLIYTMGTDSLGRWQEPGNEVEFGHATSPDLRHWTVEPPVLSGERAPWEARNRWAPQLAPRPGGGFRLYYTGVNARIAQAIGLAEAPRLAASGSWARSAANPVFLPDTTWARWRADAWSDARDPCVLERDGTFWMVLTATTRDGRGALGLARSRDGVRFEDLGPLLAGERGDPLESPQLVEIGGRWFLLFTSGREGGTWVIEGPGLRGPWDYAARRRWLESIAPEVWQDGDAWWISTHQSYPAAGGRRAYLVGFDRLRLGARGLEIVPESGLGPDWPFIEGDAFTGQPTLGDNAAARGEAGVGLTGAGYLGSAERFAWPTPPEAGEKRGDGATGRLRSRPFILGGRALSLRIGGTAGMESTYVALRRARGGEILYRETGRGVETMDERRWDVADLHGTEVVIEIADLDQRGHVNVDEIVELDGAGPSGRASRFLGGSPNPFHDAVEIHLGGAGAEPSAIAIQDVAGRHVRALAAPHGVAVWDGRNERGEPVAAGVYFAHLRSGAVEDVLRLVRSP